MDSVFDRGYKEKDGESVRSRGKKHAYVMEKVRAEENSRDQGREAERKDARARREDGESEKSVERSGILREGNRESERRREMGEGYRRICLKVKREMQARKDRGTRKMSVKIRGREMSETLKRNGIAK